MYSKTNKQLVADDLQEGMVVIVTKVIQAPVCVSAFDKTIVANSEYSPMLIGALFKIHGVQLPFLAVTNVVNPTPPVILDTRSVELAGLTEDFAKALNIQ